MMRARLAALLRRTADRLMPQPTVVTAAIDGEAIIRAIKRRNRQHGLPPNTI